MAPGESVRARRRCPICRRYFQPRRERQRACGFVCGRKSAGRTMKANGTPRQLLRQHRINRLTRRRYVAATCRARFGALTPREIDLFTFASAEGYGRGYARGYFSSKRRRRLDGAA